MTGSERSFPLKNAALLAGIAGFVGLAIQLAFFADHLVMPLFNIMLVLFVGGHLIFLRQTIVIGEVSSTSLILKSTLWLGVVASAILLPNVLNNQLVFIPPFNDLAAIVQGYFVYLYLTGSVMLMLRLVHTRREGVVTFVSYLYTIALVCAILLVLFTNILPEGLHWGILATGMILAIVLSTRLNWLAYIRPNERMNVLLMLAGSILINLFLAYALLVSSPYAPDNLYGIYFYLILFSSTLAAVVAFIGLLFYLPVSAVVDQQAQEIRSLVEISGFGKNRSGIQGLFDQLISSAINDTRSDAGWLSLKLADSDDFLKTKNINIREVQLFNERINVNRQAGVEVLDIPSLSEAGWNDLSKSYSSLLAIEIDINEKESLRLCLLKESENGFDPYAADIIKAYVGQARTAYENSLLIQETIRNERVKEEVEIAKRIQQSLIPSSFPQEDNIEIECLFEPSKMVGGDFYDHFPIDDHKMAIVIGDVSGKGIPAALHMAEIKGIFQTLHQFGLEPRELILQANKAISACFEKNIFVSLIYLVIDKKQHTFSYVRAGHCPLLYYNNTKGEAGFIEDKGLGLGIIRHDSYERHIFVYDKEYFAGDVLLLFTDGLDEARDPKSGVAFGYDRIKTSLEQAIKGGSTNIRKVVMNDFKRHVKNNENLDDLAMIVVKFG